MSVSLGGLLFMLLGLVDLGAGLWAYLGPPEPDGAPKGFRGIGRTWHGRGTVCAALPAGIFFFSLGLAASIDSDTLRRLLLYLALVSVAAALYFLFRAPQWARPVWLRDSPQV